MAPDKIFVPTRFRLVYGLRVRESDTDEEYIRKDALLEWAKAEIELSRKVECVSEKSYEEGRRQVAQNLIDKINAI